MINRMDEITALTTSSSLSHVTPEEKQYLQLLALAQLNGVDDDTQVEEFKAGDLTVKQGSKNRDAASQCLQRQAELMIAPYLKDGFSFRGV